jgi:NADP-dependent 3-hydroxy acid dehydrogenase YdfG
MAEQPVLAITGASSGIGAATARAAAEAGFRLVLAARSEGKLQDLARELGAPQRALPVRCDVTSFDDQQRMAEAALERFGRIDVLFANAGIGGSPGGFAGADPERWRDLVLTNVLGVALTLRATLGALKDSRGHAILTGSVAGRRTLAGSMYSATKWAVSAIGYGLREEDVARTVLFAVSQPAHVNLHELMVLPTPPRDS